MSGVTVYVHWSVIAITALMIVSAIESDVYANTAVCDYTIIHEGRAERSGTTRILPEGGSMLAKLLGFRPGRHAQLSITASGRRWSSPHAPYSQPFTQIELR